MTKNVIKEIIIILLILLAVIVIWFAVLYRFVPINKKIPDSVSYTTPATVKQALKSIDAVNEDEVLLTYEINQADLNNYQRINEYKPGKTNPFSTYEKKVEETTGTTGETTGTNSSTSGNNNTTTGGNTSENTSSSGTTGGSVDTSTPGTVNPGKYVNDKGTK